MTTNHQKNSRFAWVAIVMIACMSVSVLAARPEKGREKSKPDDPPAAASRSEKPASSPAEKPAEKSSSTSSRSASSAKSAGDQWRAARQNTRPAEVQQARSAAQTAPRPTAVQQSARVQPSSPPVTVQPSTPAASRPVAQTQKPAARAVRPVTVEPAQPVVTKSQPERERKSVTVTPGKSSSGSDQSTVTTTRSQTVSSPAKSAERVTRMSSTASRPSPPAATVRSTTTTTQTSRPIRSAKQPPKSTVTATRSNTITSSAKPVKTVTSTVSVDSGSPSTAVTRSKTTTQAISPSRPEKHRQKNTPIVSRSVTPTVGTSTQTVTQSVTTSAPVPSHVTVARTETVTRHAPIRVRDIKAEPDRVVIQSDRRPHGGDHRSNSTSAVSVSISSDNVSFSASSGRDRRPHRPSYRPAVRVEPAKIIINNTNVHVDGFHSTYRPRPYVAPRIYHNYSWIPHNHNWYNHGSYFSFRWSNSSCGLALYLPLSSTYYCNSYYDRSYPRDGYGLSYYYPRYHRKYVFVSLGGYWPYDYRYRRYYWYGCHPHYWYGAYVTEPVTCNTYNYYGMSSGIYGYSASKTPYYMISSNTGIIDEPEFETPADLAFARAVELFEAGKFEDAARQFREVILLSPDDVVVPFSYAQALFAAGDYAKAASVLRSAIDQLDDEELTIYFPRGLYKDEEMLTAQIEQLHQALAAEPFAADYQLLLGYQYLGTGQLDKATVYLPRAAADTANRPAAEKLLALADQLKKDAAEIH